MTHEINITLNEIKKHLNQEDCLEFRKLLDNKVKFDNKIFSHPSRWNYVKEILNEDLMWICFSIFSHLGFYGYPSRDSYKNVDYGDQIVLKMGKTDEIIEQLKQNEKNIIKGRKHFYQNEEDFGMLLYVYEPKSLKQVLEDIKNKYSLLIVSLKAEKRKVDDCLKTSLDEVSALLSILEKE